MSSNPFPSKRVLTNEELIHRFVHEEQSDCKNASGTLYVKGGIMYSYGSHYVAAVKAATGVGWLLNSTKSTPTTNQHVRDVAMEIARKPRPIIHWVPRPDARSASDHSHNLADYTSRLEIVCMKWWRARVNKPWHQATINSLYALANDYQQRFLGPEYQLSLARLLFRAKPRKYWLQTDAVLRHVGQFELDHMPPVVKAERAQPPEGGIWQHGN